MLNCVVHYVAAQLAIGYDEGFIMVQLGHETPVASMDKTGKLVVAINNVISTAAVKLSGDGAAIEDGSRVPLSLKELGSVEQYPQTVAHNANGRFVATCGDNEFVIYTAQVCVWGLCLCLCAPLPLPGLCADRTTWHCLASA